LKIHFIRVVHRDSYNDIYPIMLLHDWQSSFWEFYKLLPILSNPNRFETATESRRKIAFDVIIPSIPSLIFSEKPSRPGLGVIEVARILMKLADRLLLSNYILYSHGESGCMLGMFKKPSCPAYLF
uniref:EHN domain-containing protein n=1 Tax=Gongylonema pulchrum TaxID=637853 RepID=A0A183DE98_9BILA